MKKSKTLCQDCKKALAEKYKINGKVRWLCKTCYVSFTTPEKIEFTKEEWAGEKEK